VEWMLLEPQSSRSRNQEGLDSTSVWTKETKPNERGVLTFNRPSRGYKAPLVADRSLHELGFRRGCGLVVSGPGRPRLSEQEKHIRRVQRLKAELAQHGVIEEKMAQKEVE